MSRSIPVGDNVEHFDPELSHHRAWLLRGERCGGCGRPIKPGSLRLRYQH